MENNGVQSFPGAGQFIKSLRVLVLSGVSVAEQSWVFSRVLRAAGWYLCSLSSFVLSLTTFEITLLLQNKE